jgi:hypothetical protein
MAAWRLNNEIALAHAIIRDWVARGFNQLSVS